LAPARPWFIKYAIGYLIFLFIWLWVFTRQPDTATAKLLTSFLLVGLVPLLWFHKETRRERQVVAFARLGILILICVIGAIIDEPWIGALLVVLSLGGILMYVIIRILHRGDENSSVRIN
jgi:hypothetical protein